MSEHRRAVMWETQKLPGTPFADGGPLGGLPPACVFAYDMVLCVCLEGERKEGTGRHRHRHRHIQAIARPLNQSSQQNTCSAVKFRRCHPAHNPCVRRSATGHPCLHVYQCLTRPRNSLSRRCLHSSQPAPGSKCSVTARDPDPKRKK